MIALWIEFFLDWIVDKLLIVLDSGSSFIVDLDYMRLDLNVDKIGFYIALNYGLNGGLNLVINWIFKWIWTLIRLDFVLDWIVDSMVMCIRLHCGLVWIQDSVWLWIIMDCLLNCAFFEKNAFLFVECHKRKSYIFSSNIKYTHLWSLQRLAEKCSNKQMIWVSIQERFSRQTSKFRLSCRISEPKRYISYKKLQFSTQIYNLSTTKVNFQLNSLLFNQERWILKETCNS